MAMGDCFIASSTTKGKGIPSNLSLPIESTDTPFNDASAFSFHMLNVVDAKSFISLPFFTPQKYTSNVG